MDHAGLHPHHPRRSRGHPRHLCKRHQRFEPDRRDYADNNSIVHGFLYNPNSGTYTTLDDPLATHDPGGGTIANGINGTGQIVGSYATGGGMMVFIAHAFLLSGGTYTTIDDPLATNGTIASGINAAGQIVGFYSNATGGHGFLLSGGTYTTIDDPLANNGTIASGINDSGQIVGYYYDASNHGHGFLLSVGNYTTIDDPLGVTLALAQGINNAGQIVGQYENANVFHGFLLSGGTYTTLDGPSATNFTAASGINDSGQIVGFYSNASGNHGFLLTITPNPAPPAGTTADMILRGSNASPIVAGQYEIYDIGNNAILAAYQLGQVGTDWQFSGLGGVSGASTTMLLHNPGTGGFELYNINNNIIT